MVLPILVPTTSGKNIKILFQGFYFVQKDDSTTYRCPNHNATNGLGCTSTFTLDRDNCGKAKMIDEHNKQCKDYNASNGSKVTDRFWWNMVMKSERIEKENARISMENADLKKRMNAVENWVKARDPSFSISTLLPTQTSAQNPLPSFDQIPQNQQWPMPSFHSNEAENVQAHQRQMSMLIPSNLGHDYFLSTAGGQHYADPSAPSSSASAMKPPNVEHLEFPNYVEGVEPYQNMEVGDEDEEEEPLEDQPENVVGEWQYCSICRSFEEIDAEHKCKCNCKGNTSDDEAVDVDVVEEQSCQVFWHQPKAGNNH